jgi:osmotically-inducible protein OsmY
MPPNRSALRFGSPVRFSDRWQGSLTAFEIEDWSIANIVVSRGLLRRAEVKLPFSAASAWDDDSLTLDCASGEAFGLQIAPLPVPPRPLSPETPFSIPDTRLEGALVQRSSRRATHLLVSRGRFPTRQLHAVPVGDVAFEAGVLRLAIQADTLPAYRRDPDVLQAVVDALAASPGLTSADRRSIRVEVVDGVVSLHGNVRTSQARAAALAAVSAVPGALAIEDHLIDDSQLEIDVARALDRAGLTRQSRVYVRAAQGEVTLSGFADSDYLRPEIERLASRVAGVRSLINRVEVRPSVPRRPAA